MESEEREQTESDRSDSRLPIGGEANPKDGAIDVAMKVVLTPDRPRSWKDRLIGTGLRADDKTEISTKDEDDNLHLLNENIVRSSVNSIPIIDFSGRVNLLLIKDMEHTVSLWRPNQPFRLMDIENGYYLAKFQNLGDFEKPYPNMVMAWIWLPGLPRHMYKRKIIWEIWGMIGRVTKLDFNIDNGVRGRFARMTVYVNLGKALISQDIFPKLTTEQQVINGSIAEEKTTQGTRPEQGKSNFTTSSDAYDPWMLVERQNQRQPIEGKVTNSANKENITQTTSASSTLETKDELVTSVTMAKAHVETQGRQITIENHGTQSVVISEPQSSHCSNDGSLLEVAVTPSNAATRGKLNGNTKGQKLKRIIRDKGSPFKVTSPKVPLIELITNMVELLQEQVKQGLLNQTNEEGTKHEGSKDDTQQQK
ncbi:hypothetical protein Godav_023696 [Gossypium davidsonii]|uniref:DUF4283 domain-containing protein n=1 Tax=Gossypium davidsonii TaxID=34287 RepID=A0A7J8SSI1_GOSDV|nr:hypothetical protein [Gossypium davidsonii]